LIKKTKEFGKYGKEKEVLKIVHEPKQLPALNSRLFNVDTSMQPSPIFDFKKTGNFQKSSSLSILNSPGSPNYTTLNNNLLNQPYSHNQHYCENLIENIGISFVEVTDNSSSFSSSLKSLDDLLPSKFTKYFCFSLKSRNFLYAFLNFLMSFVLSSSKSFSSRNCCLSHVKAGVIEMSILFRLNFYFYFINFYLFHFNLSFEFIF
jgi:hypothetical protein